MFQSLCSVDVTLAVRVWVAVAGVLNVRHVLIEVRQRHGVFLVDLPLQVGLQHGPLIVREGHGEQGLGVADELIHVSFTCHLGTEKPDCYLIFQM